MPIHLRAEPGDYAEAVLVPGDPLRARYIADTFFEAPREVNAERGMLGYTGTFEGKPISVQSSGMGCPSASIVYEELVQLGVKRLVRVGTCGGLQPDLALGDLIVAISATPADGTMLTYTGGEPHAPTADFEVVHAVVHQAKHDGQRVRVGGVVSSDVFYNPDGGQYQRWSDRGILGCRDGGVRAVHDRRAAQDLGRLPPHGLGRGGRGRVRPHLRRGDARRRRPHDDPRDPGGALVSQGLTPCPSGRS